MIDQPISPVFAKQQQLCAEYADLTRRIIQTEDNIIKISKNPLDYDLVGLFRLRALRKERAIMVEERAIVEKLILRSYHKPAPRPRNTFMPVGQFQLAA